MQLLDRRPADTRRSCAAAGASVREPRSGSDPLDACCWGVLARELNLLFTGRSQRDGLIKIKRQWVVLLVYNIYRYYFAKTPTRQCFDQIDKSR
jgi:hypothetical protein